MILRVIVYNRIEIFLIVSYLLMQYYGGIWTVALWSGLALSAWWVIMTGTKEAEYHARYMVQHNALYVGHTLTGGLLLVVLAGITIKEMWFFPVMFLLAAAQHLRYTCLIRGWTKENERKNINNRL